MLYYNMTYYDKIYTITPYYAVAGRAARCARSGWTRRTRRSGSGRRVPSRPRPDIIIVIIINIIIIIIVVVISSRMQCAVRSTQQFAAVRSSSQYAVRST